MVTMGSLVEVTTVLRRVAEDRGLDGNQAARDGLRKIRSHAAYREAGSVDAADVAALYESEPKLSLVDAWNIVASERCREPFVTFDEDVDTMAKRRRK